MRQATSTIIDGLLLCLALLVPAAAWCADEPARVVATTGIIGDLVENIGGADVQALALMGPGVDPHLYQATQGDLARLKGADLIFFNGLHLEGKMQDVLVRLAQRQPVVAVTRSIPENRLLKPENLEGNFDPHVWFDIELWLFAAQVVEDELKKLRPEHAHVFAANGNRHRAKLQELHTWVKEQMALIPAQQRVLITAHDAFGYFGRAYGLEVMGLQGISTASEYGLYDLARLTQVIIAHKIKAIFVESSVPHRFVEALQQGVLAKGWQVSIGGELFSDALGPRGTAQGTYVGMMRHNVSTIVGALK